MDNWIKLIEAAEAILNLPEGSIDGLSGQDNIKSWDSLAMVNLVTELQAIFEVEFDILEIAEFHNIEIIKLVLMEKGIDF
jgi:acyl carrier protein